MILLTYLDGVVWLIQLGLYEVRGRLLIFNNHDEMGSCKGVGGWMAMDGMMRGDGQ